MKNLLKKVAVAATITAMAVSTSAFAAGVSNATLSSDRKTLTFTGSSTGTMTYVVYSKGDNETLEDTDTIYGIDQLNAAGAVTVTMPSSFVSGTANDVVVKVGGDGTAEAITVSKTLVAPTVVSTVDNAPIEVDGAVVPRTLTVDSSITPNDYAVSAVATSFVPVIEGKDNSTVTPVVANFELAGNISGEGSFKYTAVLQAPTSAAGYQVEATTTATYNGGTATDDVTGTILN